MTVDPLALRQRREHVLALKQELLRRLVKKRCEDSLYEFVKNSWSAVDKSPFVGSWALEGLCLHLEAVTHGRIRRLVVNFPPRCAKTTIVSIMWPVWCWLQHKRTTTSGPTVGFLTASYNQDLSCKHASKMRQLIESRWFQRHWPGAIRMREDQNSKSDFANKEGGYRQSTSIRGQLIGMGGGINILDDPHNTESAESEADREKTLDGWKEFSTTRLNDPKRSAIVVVMQRLHEDDVTGSILSGETSEDWVHYMVPMRYDPVRHCSTFLGTDAAGEPITWSDPRSIDGELMWPERFGERDIRHMEIVMGPYRAAGRLQQSPRPASGGIVPPSWWKVYDEDSAPDFGMMIKPGDVLRYPAMYYVVISVDTAYKEGEENDWNACTAWGICYDRLERPRVIMTHAWRWRGPLLGEKVSGLETEFERQKKWGLTERVLDTARKRHADMILIEDKTRGTDLAREIRRLIKPGEMGCTLVNPAGDKTSRLNACVPMFADGLVFAPDKQWATDVITEVSQVPKGKHDDMADTVTQAILWLRRQSLLRLSTEADTEKEERDRFECAPDPHYDV